MPLHRERWNKPEGYRSFETQHGNSWQDINAASIEGEQLFKAGWSRGTGNKEMKLNIRLLTTDYVSLESLLLLREERPQRLKDSTRQKWASSSGRCWQTSWDDDEESFGRALSQLAQHTGWFPRADKMWKLENISVKLTGNVHVCSGELLSGCHGKTPRWSLNTFIQLYVYLYIKE